MKLVRYIGLSALASLASLAPANAQIDATLTATSATDYDWDTAGNWDVNSVPGFPIGTSNDTATIRFNVSGTPIIHFSAAEHVFLSLTIDESAAVTSTGNFYGDTGFIPFGGASYTQYVQRIAYTNGGSQIDFYQDLTFQDWADGNAFEVDTTGGNVLDFGGGITGSDGIRIQGNDTVYFRGYNMSYGAGLSNGLIFSGEVGGNKSFYIDATAGPVTHDIPNLVIENSGALNINFGRLAGSNSIAVNISNVVLTTNTTSLRFGGDSEHDGTPTATVNVNGQVDFSVATAAANRTLVLNSTYGGIVNFNSNIVVNQDLDVARTIVWNGNGVARVNADIIQTNGSLTSLTNRLDGDRNLVVEVDAESRLGTGNVDIRNGSVLRMAYDVYGDTNGYPGSSFRYGESANTFFDFATNQSGFFDPVANNVASGLVVRAFNGISGNLTGANFTNASGFYAGNTIAFQTNAIIGERATALPTRAQLGGAILYQGIQTAGGTYTNIGDDGATSIYKGVAITALTPMGTGELPVLDDPSANLNFQEDTFLSGFFGTLSARPGQDLEVLIPGNVFVSPNSFGSNATFNASTGVAYFRGPGTLSFQRRYTANPIGTTADPWEGTVSNLVRIGLDGTASPENPLAIQSQSSLIADLIGTGAIPQFKTMTVRDGRIRVRGGDNIGEATGATDTTLVIGSGASLLPDDGTGNNAATITLNRGKIIFEDDGALYTGTEPDVLNASTNSVFNAMQFSSNCLFVINDGSSGTAGLGAFRNLNTALYTHMLSNMNIVIGDDSMRTARVANATAFAIGDGKRLTQDANSNGNLNRLITISGSTTSDVPVVAVAGASNVMITASGARTFTIGASVITTNALLTTLNSFTNRFITVLDDGTTRSNATQNGTIAMNGSTNLFKDLLLQGGTASISGTNAVANNIESRGMRGATAALRFFADFNTVSNALSTDGGDLWFGNNAGDISTVFGDIVVRDTTNDTASIILGSGIVQVAGNIYADGTANTNAAFAIRIAPQISTYADTGIVTGTIWIGPTNPSIAGSALLRVNDQDTDVTIVGGDIVLNQGAAYTTGSAINRGDLVVSNNIVVNAYGIDRRTTTNALVFAPSGNANLLQIYAYRDVVTNDGVGILDRLTDGTMALGSDGIIIKPYGQVLVDYNRTNNITYTIGQKITIDNGGPLYKEDQAMLWMRATTNAFVGGPGTGTPSVNITNVWLNENAHLRIDEDNAIVSVGLVLAGTNTAIGEGTPTQADDFDLLDIRSSSPGSPRTLAIGTTNSPVANDSTFETSLLGISSPDVTLDIINGTLNDRRDLGGDIQGSVTVRRLQALLITAGPDAILDLAGSGRVIGDISVSNNLSPGDLAFNPGTLTVTGDVRFFDTTVFNFDLRGDNMTVDGGINDLLSIDGPGSDIILDGILNVSGIGTFTNAVLGDTWTIIRYGGLLTSNGVDLGTLPELAPGLTWALSYDLVNQWINLTVAIPEPTTWVLIFVGLGIAALAIRRRP